MCFGLNAWHFIIWQTMGYVISYSSNVNFSNWYSCNPDLTIFCFCFQYLFVYIVVSGGESQNRFTFYWKSYFFRNICLCSGCYTISFFLVSGWYAISMFSILVATVKKLIIVMLYFTIESIFSKWKCFFFIIYLYFCIWLLGSDDDVIPEADENGEPEVEEEEEEYYDDLYCVACNRAFKTDKA